jgi:TPR repeat protein
MFNWIDGLQRALAYIEAHLADELATEDAAREACVSPFHFQRLFGAVCGVTVGEYIRLRRLTLAGGELSRGGSRVMDVAIKYGYDSPDSFARAFNTALEAQSKGDYEKAIELYTLAAEMGHRASACNLGYCYQVGEGCRKDMKRAVYYYRIAAEDGSPTAKYNLAICYKQGGGVHVDFKEAERLLLECREGGYEKKVDAILKEMRERKVAKLAQKFYSASCTVYRKGNLDSATRLRVMASKLGSAKAEYLIGCQFEFGDGLPKDISKARLWYDKARKHGFIDPVNSMKQAYLREKRIVEIINKVD